MTAKISFNLSRSFIIFATTSCHAVHLVVYICVYKQTMSMVAATRTQQREKPASMQQKQPQVKFMALLENQEVFVILPF